MLSFSLCIILLAVGNQVLASQAAKNVAIIGAGAAGSSAAYHLRKFADESGVPVNITVFERESRPGGRSTTIHPYYNSSVSPVELGASIFVEVNHILWAAAEELNLTKRSYGGDNDGMVGVWNGQEFVLTLGHWWDLPSLVWRYGLSLWRAYNLRKEVVGKFSKIYDAPMFPWLDLTQTAAELGLLDATGMSGADFVHGYGISDQFSNEVLQSLTRVNYASNLRFIHGLETMVSFSTDNAVSIEGGNWQVFDRMVKASKADLRANTRVEGCTWHSASSKFTLVTDKAASERVNAGFDSIILAAPYQYAGIDFGPDDTYPDIVPKQEPYRSLHVTLFTSPNRPDPAAFGLKSEKQVPLGVLTTLQPDESPGDEQMSVGRAGFLSFTQHGVLLNPKTGAEEFVYKIFSLEEIGAEFLGRMLGVGFRKDGSDPAEVTWIHRHLFNSYPIKKTTEFSPLRLAKNLWYTSGIETFISTMETSALSGKNVARLIVDEWKMDGKEAGGPSDGRQYAEALQRDQVELRRV